MESLVNKVAASGLITINLEEFYPKMDIVQFDIKQYLFMELILKEKDFRAALTEINWADYTDKVVCVYCSTDAIIPVWAYMLVCSYVQPFAKEVYLGNQEEFIKAYFTKTIDELDYTNFEHKRIVIKGCSDKPVPASAYLDITTKLRPIAQSIFYGEPCSTVPIFKKKAEK